MGYASYYEEFFQLLKQETPEITDHKFLNEYQQEIKILYQHFRNMRNTCVSDYRNASQPEYQHEMRKIKESARSLGYEFHFFRLSNEVLIGVRTEMGSDGWSRVARETPSR